MPRRKTPTLFIVSDGRGETAAQLVKAAAVQYEGERYRVVRRANVRTAAQVRRAVEEAARRGAVVFYTLVAEDTRQAMRQASGERLVPTVDVLGPAFTALHDVFPSERGSTPGLLYAVERERIDRMEAIDYTLKHDDGQRPHELPLADVVLVGVSRAAKSSTCFCLAYVGVRAANVPLVPGLAVPQPLAQLAPEKVIGLRVNVPRLLTVREARARNLGRAELHGYLDKRSIAREVLQANRTMEQHGWRSFDASYLAVEEIAKQVLRLRGIAAGLPW